MDNKILMQIMELSETAEQTTRNVFIEIEYEWRDHGSALPDDNKINEIETALKMHQDIRKLVRDLVINEGARK